MSLASKIDGKYLELTHDGSTAWQWNTATHGWGSKAQFVALERIMWIPNATDDVICIRNGGIAGPIILYAKAVDVYDQRIVYFNGEICQPVIDESTTTGEGQIVCFTIR
jgi:hypothetical protein